MASTFSPRNRGDREFQKFGLDGTVGDTNPIGLSVGGYTSTTIFKNLLVAADGTLQTSAAVTIGDISGSVQLTDGTNNALVTSSGRLQVDATISDITGSVRIGDGAGNFVTITSNKLDVNATISDVTGSVRIGDGAGNFVNVTSDNNLKVTGTVQLTANSGVDIGDVDILSITAGDNNIGNVDIVTFPSANLTTDNNLKVTGTVEITTMPNVTIGTFPDNEPFDLAQYGGSAVGAGNAVHVQPGTGATFPVSATLLDIRGLSNVIDSVRVSGDVASDGVDSGNPIKVGGRAYNLDGSVPGTAVAENDRANFITDIYGRQFVETTHPNLWKYTANYTAAQTDTQLVASPGAGLSLYLTDMVMSMGGAAGSMKLVDGNAGGAQADLISYMIFAARGGATVNFRTPLKLVANSSLSLTSLGEDHSVLVVGFTAP